MTDAGTPCWIASALIFCRQAWKSLCACAGVLVSAVVAARRIVLVRGSIHRFYHEPAMVIPSIRTVGALVELLNCRSLAGVRFRNISLRLLATVMPLTGQARLPFSIQKPEAPRL